MIALYLNTRTEDGSFVPRQVAIDSAVHKFELTTSVDSLGAGFIIINDTQFRLLRTFVHSDLDGYIELFSTHYTNTGTKANSIYPISVTSWTKIGENANDAYLRIDFKVGTFNYHSSRSIGIASKSSIDAMKELVSTRGESIYELSDTIQDMELSKSLKINTGDAPKNGAWQIYSCTMEEELNYVVDHSFLTGDILYWCYDDKVNSLHSATVRQKMSLMDKNIIVWNDNNPMNEQSSHLFNQQTGVNVYVSASIINYSNAGLEVSDLLPNVSYIYKSPKEVKYNVFSFREYLKTIEGDDYLLNFDYNKKLSGRVMSFGDLTVKQMSNLNTNEYHAFSPDYRKLLWGMFAKNMYLDLSYTIGPSVGEYVTLISFEQSQISNQFAPYDGVYSDRYIVYGKKIQYDLSTRLFKSRLDIRSFGNGLPRDYVDMLDPRVKGMVKS